MQSNYASDLRNILRNVFDLNRSPEEDDICVEEAVEAKELIEFTDIIGSDPSAQIVDNSSDELNGPIHRSDTLTNENSLSRISGDYSPTTESIESDEIIQNLSDLRERVQTVLLPPIWVPDELVSICTDCCSPFTIIRRRHHCRNCGQIYCNNCSNNFMPLVRYGYVKPVRVCHSCHRQLQQIPTQT